MRCLIAFILMCACAIAALTMGWHWHGWWGLLSVAASGFVLLWLVTEIGPHILDRVQVETLQIVVHSVHLAEESDAVPEMLRQFDGWMGDFNEEPDADGYHIECDEFLTHNEERPDLARYEVDITVAPPADKPHQKWTPYSIGLKPVETDDLSCVELHDVQCLNTESGDCQPIPGHAILDVTGELRLRLHVRLDPEIRTYQFAYTFGISLDATIEIPVPDWTDTPLRRFTLGVLDRLGKYRPLKTLSLNCLDPGDSDLDQIGGITELECLALSHSSITNDGLRRLIPLQNLTSLDLDGTHIDNDSVGHLAKLTAVQRLYVHGTSISRSGLRELRTENPGLKIYGTPDV